MLMSDRLLLAESSVRKPYFRPFQLFIKTCNVARRALHSAAAAMAQGVPRKLSESASVPDR